MSAPRFSRILRHDAPGETRAVLIDSDRCACRLFLERWNGEGEPARYGSVHSARLRSFADAEGGAFLELECGEEAFLRLKSRDGLTEGARIDVEIASEARADKLARVVRANPGSTEADAWTSWISHIPGGTDLPVDMDADAVTAAFDEAGSASITLPGGGQIHIDRTRALTAVDIDTSGRQQKGSAGARALSLNKRAVSMLARQISLRGLGGNIVLDCVGPLNKSANEQIQAAAYAAFESMGLAGVKVLRPSPLGLLQVSVPWRVCPVEDRLASDPGATDLLSLLRAAQREAIANPAELYQLILSKPARQAYLEHRSAVDRALTQHFGGRVTVCEHPSETNKVQKR
jgi:hypothetical protein